MAIRANLSHAMLSEGALAHCKRMGKELQDRNREVKPVQPRKEAGVEADADSQAWFLKRLEYCGTCKTTSVNKTAIFTRMYSMWPRNGKATPVLIFGFDRRSGIKSALPLGSKDTNE